MVECCVLEQTYGSHVLLYSRDSILKGLGRMVILGVDSSPSSPRHSSSLGRRVMEQSSGSSLESPPPTTSIGASSSSISESEFTRCCDKYSAFRVSRSTVMPLERNLRAWRSSALANFFRRRALFSGADLRDLVSWEG